MPKRLNLKDVVIKILKEEGKPLRIKEIYQRIKEDDLYHFNTDNPEHIVRTMLRRQSENIDFPTARKIKHFTFLDNGAFWLKNEVLANEADKPEKKVQNREKEHYQEIIRLHKVYTANFKKTILKQLANISPRDFEIFCKELLKAYGFKNLKVTRAIKDGGIDGFGELKIGLATMPVAFECKRWNNTVGRPKISQFRGDIQGKFQQGVFFTTSHFSKEAKESSFQNGAVPIILIDGNGIIDLMINESFGIEKEELPIYSSAIDLILQK